MIHSIASSRGGIKTLGFINLPFGIWWSMGFLYKTMRHEPFNNMPCCLSYKKHLTLETFKPFQNFGTKNCAKDTESFSFLSPVILFFCVWRSNEVTYLPVKTLIGASERRKEEVSYQMHCRVNPESCSRAARA